MLVRLCFQTDFDVRRCVTDMGGCTRKRLVGMASSFEFNPLMGTLKLQSNRLSYSNTVIDTLAVDGWAVTFGTARSGLGGLWPRPASSSLYQMEQPTHQRPVYRLYIIR